VLPKFFLASFLSKQDRALAFCTSFCHVPPGSPCHLSGFPATIDVRRACSHGSDSFPQRVLGLDTNAALKDAFFSHDTLEVHTHLGRRVGPPPSSSATRAISVFRHRSLSSPFVFFSHDCHGSGHTTSLEHLPYAFLSLFHHTKYFRLAQSIRTLPLL